jgi:uncharacterized protein
MIKDTEIDITVTPKSSRSGIVLNDDNTVRAYLNSPPADGKANAELVKILSKKLDIAKSRITISKGEKGRKKRIAVSGISREDIFKLFAGE